MKKFIIAASIMTAIAAQAQTSVTVLYTAQDTVGSALKSQNTALIVKRTINSTLDADVGVYTNQFEKINLTSTRQEIGITGKTSMFGVGAYVRGATGVKNISGADTVGYYSVEPGVSVTVPFVQGLTATIAYRYRDSYSSTDSIRERSDTTRYAVSYDLTRVDKITLRYDDQRGGGSNTMTGLMYTRAF